MKKIFFLCITLVMILFITNCSNNEDTIADNQVDKETRALGEKTPKLAIYIETNDINPLNMGEYKFTDSDEEVVDHVILFASNIQGTLSTVKLRHNPNQTHILNNVNTLIKPLQCKGIKVLLGLLGDHTGIGFANLTYEQIQSFAQQVADCVYTYELDGVDLVDRYAKYGRIPGTPSPSGENFSNLILALREKMPDKLITALYFSYAISLTQAAKDVLDYTWPDFGIRAAPSTVPNSKWARMSIQYTAGYPSDRQIQMAATNYGNYGAIMMFNLREYDASAKLNLFAPRIWERTVTWTGISHPKNY